MNIGQNQLIYIYCVTREHPVIGSSWHEDGILCFEVNSLYVTLKFVSEDEYSETNVKKNISNESWLDINVRKHLKVICDIMQTNTVIPFNFGTIYKSEDNLRDFLSTYSADFIDVLRHLANKEEWSVKVFCDKDKIIENISLFSQNVSDIELQIKSSTPGKAYILKKKKQDILEKEINCIYNNISKRVFTRLNELPDEYCLHSILPVELSEKNIDMIVNATFLIKIEQTDNFLKLADNLIAEHENIGLLMEITGPWPPYSFINLST